VHTLLSGSCVHATSKHALRAPLGKNIKRLVRHFLNIFHRRHRCRETAAWLMSRLRDLTCLRSRIYPIWRRRRLLLSVFTAHRAASYYTRHAYGRHWRLHGWHADVRSSPLPVPNSLVRSSLRRHFHRAAPIYLQFIIHAYKCNIYKPASWLSQQAWDVRRSVRVSLKHWLDCPSTLQVPDRGLLHHRKTSTVNCFIQILANLNWTFWCEWY